MSQTPPEPEPSAEELAEFLATRRRPHPRWYYSVWFVLFMLFFVLGPLGLPLLWKSPRFNKAAKIGLTIVMALYTWWLIATSITMARLILDHVNQSLSPLGL